MGAATRHRKDFLKAHPRCVFCGGEVAATTIEHCPPRAMFQHRQWPEGFEFPACQACNQSSGDQDLLISFLARMDPFENKGDKDGRLSGLMRMVNKQFPNLIAEMMPSVCESRRHNRELGLRPLPGQTQQETGVVKLPKELNEAVCVFARKLAKGMFYRETGTIFPSEGCLLLNWFTNADLIRDGRYVIFDLLKELGGNAPPLKRSGKYLNDQFEYKLSLSGEKDLFVVQAKFGNAFGLVLFGATARGRLEAIVTRLREQTERQGPFAVLQSPILA